MQLISWAQYSQLSLDKPLSLSTLLFCLWCNNPTWASSTSLLKFLDHIELDTQAQAVGLLRMSDQPIKEIYATHKHKRQTSMPIVGFEPTIPAIKWLQG